MDGRKGKILIWFVQRGRMHLLLTKEALTIVVLLTCLTKLILLRWSVQYAKAIGQYYKRLKGVVVVVNVGVGVIIGVYHK